MTEITDHIEKYRVKQTPALSRRFPQAEHTGETALCTLLPIDTVLQGGFPSKYQAQQIMTGLVPFKYFITRNVC